MSQSPAYLRTKVIEIDSPSNNSFIDLSAPAYGLPKKFHFYGLTSNTIVNAACTGYQEFYDGGSGSPLLSFDIHAYSFFMAPILRPFSSFMEEDSYMQILSGLNLYFNESAGTVSYCSLTVFYK